MRDDSLMNPVHLKSEIKYLETFLVPEREERIAELIACIDKAFKPLNYTRRQADDTIVLSSDEVEDMLNALAGCKVDLQHTSRTDAFYLRVYKALLKDRRWLIASKLKFLAK